MTKQNLLTIIPLLIIAGLILYSWITVLNSHGILVWQHYTALLLFIPLIYLFTKNRRKAIIGIIIYLILGTCNILALDPFVISNSYGIRIGSVTLETPLFQRNAFGILMLLCVLNFEALVDMYLDFKEMRQKTKVQERIEVDDECVLIKGNNFAKKILWNEITQMNAFKSDFLTFDRIELELIYGDHLITINEDMEGWNLFIDKAKELFSTMPKDWDIKIVKPPFESNFSVIYTKDQVENDYTFD